MDSIDAETTLHTIMSFMDHGSASEIRRSEKRMKTVMDSDHLWKKTELSTGIMENPRESYHASTGLHGIINRSSFKEWKCVSCGSVSDIPIHPFYKTVVCKKCRKNKIEYHVMGEKAACKKYFIKSTELGEVSRIERSRGVFSVLEHQVKSVAENKLGREAVRSKLEKRRRISDTIQSNRLWSYKRRLHILTMYTRSALMRSSVRVDSDLMDVSVILRLAGRYSLYYHTIRDILDFKVRANFSVEHASERLFDLACFLSNCRRNGIIMEDYESMCPHHDDFDVRAVFVEHCRGQMHFYEYMSKYTKSIESLLSRSRTVLLHTSSMGESASRTTRQGVCEILCAEEGLIFSENNMLGEYIEYGTGDPVTIIRDYRKMLFLYSNGYNDEVNYYVSVHRMCPCRASIYARKSVLRRVRGFPIMDRLFLDDRIHSM